MRDRSWCAANASCARRSPSGEAYCPRCGKSLDVDYDYELAAQRLRETPMDERPLNIWFLEELLPIHDAVGAARVGEYAGFTPLIKADRLGAAVGLRNLYVKDDSTSRPSLSYKDRVVRMAVARLLELGRQEIGCVSTGNVGTAVASLAAKAGVAAYVFYPNRLESTKAHACRALGAKVCQVEGNYDEANKACRALAEATGLEFANITLRPFYAEGAKTEAYEIVRAARLALAGPHRLAGRRGDALLAHPQGPAGARAGGPRGDRAHQDRHRPARRLPADRRGDPHGGLGDPGRQADDARPLAGDRLAGRRGVRDRRRPRPPRARRRRSATRRSSRASTCWPRPRAYSPSRPGGTTVAVVKKLAAGGHLDPDEVVVAMITGNGLKTLYDHPVQAVAVEGAVRHGDDALRARGLPARGRPRRGQRATARVTAGT